MIIKVKLIVSVLEVRPPDIKTAEKTVTTFPLTISDIKTWFCTEDTVKVVCPNLFDMLQDQNSIFELDHTLQEFENLLRVSMKDRDKLLSKRELEILDYLIRNNDYAVQGDLFEG